MNQSIRTYRPNLRRVSVIGFVLCSILAVLFWSVGLRDTWIDRAIGTVCGLVAVLLVFYKEIGIDTDAGVVTETTLLFGLVPVRKRTRRLSEFRAICWYVSSVTDGGSKTWAVVLDPEVGYPLDLKYFSSSTASFEASEFAEELGRATGLEFREEKIERLFGFRRLKRVRR